MRKLLEGIRDFQGRGFQAQRDLFHSLAKRQRPLAMFIACSDSRVVPNLITRTDPGDLFTLRNAGNLVPVFGDDGVGEAATIEYAVKALAVPDIVVCGHTQCGAMQAVVNPELCADFPTVASWVAKAQPVVDRVREKFGNELSSEELIDAVIQENVLMQIENLRTHPSVAEGLEKDTLRLHGWVYSIGTGEMLAYEGASGTFIACDKERSDSRDEVLSA